MKRIDLTVSVISGCLDFFKMIIRYIHIHIYIFTAIEYIIARYEHPPAKDPAPTTQHT